MTIPRWAAPVPRCPEHGHTTYDRRARMWTCTGWDGEGCGYTLPGDDLDYLTGDPGEIEVVRTNRNYL